PGTDRSTHHLEVRHRYERADVERSRRPPEQEPRQADVPERAQRIDAFRSEQTPQRPRAAEYEHRRHTPAYVRAYPRRPADRQCGEIDQPVPGRHIGGYVVEAVDVDLE